MNKTFRRSVVATLALTALLGLGAVANAAVIVDDSGAGFIGKGDVQIVFTWTNKDLQDNAKYVKFRNKSVTEVSWKCTKDNGNVQERELTTTTQGLLTSTARMKTQVTGFNLVGYDQSTLPTSKTEGPALNTCPNNWTLTTPAGDPVLVDGGSLTEVSINGSDWFELEPLN